MSAHLLHVSASGNPLIPARVCGLLAQRNIPLRTIQAAQDTRGGWSLFLQVDLDDPGRLALVIKQLNRLVDVERVVSVSHEPGHQRQSLFVTVRPTAAGLGQVTELVRQFGAEVLELGSHGVQVHLSATEDRCRSFLDLLYPYRVIASISGAVAAPTNTVAFRQVGDERSERRGRRPTRPASGRRPAPEAAPERSKRVRGP